MSRQQIVQLAVRDQGTQFVNNFINHPDFRLVATFFLGWVFFSGLRHVWISTFLRELMWYCKAMFDRLRGRTEESVTSAGSLHGKSAGAHPSLSDASELYQREQRDTLVLLLCMMFMLASLSSFLSLLTFDTNGSGSACVFVVAATAVASIAARVFGLLILSFDLRRRMARPWELYIFWTLLGLGTVLGAITVGIGTGQLVTLPGSPNVSLCFRNRFLPSSLTSSILNFILELYIIIRSLTLIQPPRLMLNVVQDARIVQAGSLFFFDLLVVVPNTTETSLVVEFVSYSIGALSILAAFNSSFDLVPTRLNGPSAIGGSEPSIHPADMSDHVIHIADISAIASPNRDIEAYASPSHSPRATGRDPTPSLDGPHEEAIPTSFLTPVEISVHDTVPPVAQLEPGNRLRREKILSYSSPVWATFGTPQDEKYGASSRPQISIDITESPTSSTANSPERDSRVLSPSSTILGSDIIRSNNFIDRMRVRRSEGFTFSRTESIPSSSSRRVTHQSWAPRPPTYPSAGDDILQPRPILPKERVQPSRSTSSLSSKSKPASKSSRSAKSHKSSSSSSMHSMRVAVTIPAEGSSSGPAGIGSPTSPARHSMGFSVTTRVDRASPVRGPRPPPSVLRRY